MNSPASTSDPQFLERVRARDHGTLEEVVQRYSTTLLRAAFGLGFSDELGEELVQRVWTTFFEVAPRFEGRSHLRTFLFGILYHKASEMRRQANRPDAPDPIDAFMEEKFGSRGHYMKDPVDPERFAIALQTGEFIKECLDGLPAPQRLAFWLREVEGEETEAICKVFDVSVTNLGVMLFRARNKLRECLEGKV